MSLTFPMKPTPKPFQARLLCAVALGIASSFSLAAATFSDANWTSVGSGMDSYVKTLAVSGSDVYAGGSFTAAGGNAVGDVAKWDGSSWSALGSGLSGAMPGEHPYVFALAVSGSNLYAGGGFTMAGGAPANHIAK